MNALASLSTGATGATTSPGAGDAAALIEGAVCEAGVAAANVVNAADASVSILTAFQQIMAAADNQVVAVEGLPLTLIEAQVSQSLPPDIGSKPEAPDLPAVETDEDQSALTAALASMAYLPWPVTAPLEQRIIAAPVVSSGTEVSVSAAASKVFTAAVADSESALTPQLPALALQPAEAAAPVLAALLPDPDGEKTLLPDTAGKAVARPRSDVLLEVAASFTPISRAAPQVAVPRSVAVPVHDARWPQAIAAEVRWCADNGVQSATLKLTPENLGPLEVRVDIKDGQVNVNFGATHAETRNALEQSLPRLRELLSGAGLSLGQANVQQEPRRESQMSGSTPRALFEERAEDGFVPIRVAAGLVDEYA